MEPDPRLRDPSFNPNDDPACANNEFTWTREHAHCVITLFDRLCVAGIQGELSYANHIFGDAHTNATREEVAISVAQYAIAMLEVRAKLFGVRID